MTVGQITTTDLLVAKAPSKPRGTAPGPRFSPEPSAPVRTVILVVAAILFLVPLLTMLEFSLRVGQPVKGVQSYGFAHYVAIFDPANATNYANLFVGIQNSLWICLLTVAIVLLLLLPTMLLVELRFPRLRGLLQFICIIPITIPSIVLVVGFVPVYSVVASIFGSNAWTLGFAVGVIVLPYAFRPIAANMAGVELTILSEASRSLGGSWADTIWRVILPNLRRGIFASTFITIAVVLGEYTIASFLSQNTFQTALVLVQHVDPYVAVIFSLLALILAFVLLLIIGRVGAVRPGESRRSRKAS